MTEPIWRELDAWVKEYAGPLSSSAENDLCDIVGRLVAAEREACAKIAERDFAQPGEPEMDLPVDVARITIADAIRARGQT